MRSDGSSIKALLDHPHTSRFLISHLLTSNATLMTSLALSLLALHEFESSTFAGVVILLGNVGALFAPFAGTLLDNHDRKRLILLDMSVSASTLAAIGVLSMTDDLSRTTMLGLAAIGSSTSALTTTGLRISLTQNVPSHLLDMATGMMFNARAAARVVGPLTAGVVGALGDPGLAVVICALSYLMTIALVIGLPMNNDSQRLSDSIFAQTVSAMAITFSHKTIRRCFLFAAVAFFGWGAILGATAPLVQESLGHSSAITGLVFATFGIADVIGGFITAHQNTAGREWLFISAAAFIAAIGMFLCSIGLLPMVLIGAALIGLAETPTDHVIHVLRQRSVPSQQLGRVVAIGGAVSGLVFFSGSAFTAFVSDTSPQLAFAIGGSFIAIGAVLPLLYQRVDKRSVSIVRSDQRSVEIGSVNL